MTTAWMTVGMLVLAGAAAADCSVTPQGCEVKTPQQIEGHSDATGGGVREEGFGQYRTETGTALRDTGFGRLQGGGVTLRYQGKPPLRSQRPQRNCRVQATGSIICF
ncbi:MAG: hypothetical protein OIF47_11340 [Marinibacterium sp.]|nr:hypothetical protein [Marinibacterium sp.]